LYFIVNMQLLYLSMAGSGVADESSQEAGGAESIGGIVP
jgi:hypothetical protein